MKILQLISSGGFYGAERMVTALSRSLLQQSCEVRVGIFENSHRLNSDLGDELMKFGVPVEKFSCRGKADWGTIAEIRSLLHSWNPDLIHSHGYKADLYGLVAARTAGTCSVATCHNWPSPTLKMRAYALADQLCLRYFGAIAAVSHEVAAQAQRFGSLSNLRVIGNGIDIERFNGTPKTSDPMKTEPLEIGIVGRLAPEKNHELLLQAMAGVRQAFRLTFVGEGPERQRIVQRASDLGLTDHLRITGHRADMAEMYKALDLVVLPSTTEGSPMTVLEAMACCRPVIASAVGDIPKVIKDGDNGILVPAGDVPSLRNAVVRLMSDKSLRSSLSVNGQNTVRSGYSSEAMSRNYLDLYEIALKRKSKQRRLPLIATN